MKNFFQTVTKVGAFATGIYLGKKIVDRLTYEESRGGYDDQPVDSVGVAENSRQTVQVDDSTSRPEMILDYLRSNKQATMNEFVEILPDVSERTIRRDLSGLISKGKITKKGTTKSAKYILNE